MKIFVTLVDIITIVVIALIFGVVALAWAWEKVSKWLERWTNKGGPK